MKIFPIQQAELIRLLNSLNGDRDKYDNLDMYICVIIQLSA